MPVSRRGFLGGGIAAIIGGAAAPALIRAESLLVVPDSTKTARTASALVVANSKVSELLGERMGMAFHEQMMYQMELIDRIRPATLLSKSEPGAALEKVEIARSGDAFVTFNGEPGGILVPKGMTMSIDVDVDVKRSYRIIRPDGTIDSDDRPILVGRS